MLELRISHMSAPTTEAGTVAKKHCPTIPQMMLYIVDALVLPALRFMAGHQILQAYG